MSEGGTMLIIVGASVRAAAFSALRAGVQPWCADLFADRDLTSRLATHVLPPIDYPRGFVELLSRAPDGPWMYTGALENHRPLVHRRARRRTLWGNDDSILAVVRSPRRVWSMLRDAGLASPAVRSTPPHDGALWLVKPVAGAAGIGIRLLKGQEQQKRSSKVYYQAWIDGSNISAVYVALPGQVQLLGVIRQLIGEPWLGTRGFRYCGSVGPLPVEPRTRDSLQRYGDV